MPQEALVVFQSPVGTYHVEHHGAGVHAVFFKARRAKKPKIIANAGSLEGALRRISEHEGDLLEPDAPRVTGKEGPVSIYAVGRRTTPKTATQLDREIAEFLASRKG
ncbi:MAG TPA: hypothetical protein VLE97_11565 [Gaiellaceae bacterium]|nr:hypothetical protein [Gaiellaceae bacterium]